jgi:hypothetical protein
MQPVVDAAKLWMPPIVGAANCRCSQLWIPPIVDAAREMSVSLCRACLDGPPASSSDHALVSAERVGGEVQSGRHSAIRYRKEAEYMLAMDGKENRS